MFLMRKITILAFILLCVLGTIVTKKTLQITQANELNSIEQLPDANKGNQYSEKAQQKIFTMVAAGDIMLGGRMSPFLEEHGPTYPFKNLKSTVLNADIAIGNLEAPIGLEGNPVPGKTFTFIVPPKHAAGIKDAGFDIVSMANNHILDYGEKALESTFAYLDSAGILYCGAGKNLEAARSYKIIEVDSLKFAFLAYTSILPETFYARANKPGTVEATDEYIVPDIRKAKQEADFVIVSIHWGIELTSEPQTYQQILARTAIDAGADVILGHHPHILQGFEQYQGKLIAYSLGNFTFGSYSPNAHESAILKLYFNESEVLYAEILPIYVYNFKVHFQPYIESGEQAFANLTHLQTISKKLNTEIKIESGKENEYRGFISLSTDPPNLTQIKTEANSTHD